MDDAMAAIDALQRHNAERRAEVEAVRDRQVAAHRAAAERPPAPAPLPVLEARIAAVLSARSPGGAAEPQFATIERARHGGDIALKFPQLLRRGGPKAFVRDHLPWIVEALSGPELADAVARVDAQGMYVNLTVTDRWLLDGAQAIADAGPAFGHGDALAGDRIVVDYSSPNVAKTLHAGHIRSTILGHVLSNLYEACGALVFRVNHINDFGGFGYTLEGYRRFADALALLPAGNDRLLEIYRIRRTLERLAGAMAPLDGLDEADRALLGRYLPDVSTAAELKDAFRAFTDAADRRFVALEAGDEEEVALWREMVGWSLAEFDRFYGDINVRFDLVIGESFYFEAGDATVDGALADGRALLFTEAEAGRAAARLDARLNAGEIAGAERDSLAALAIKDVGAVVVPLDRDERYVVRRADGRSIYATRDLGAIALRRILFAPTAAVYVVGQEQQVHFDRLFRAAVAIGIAEPGAPRFQHLYFGFYVDAATGRKLSSRDSVANVGHLLAEARRYFRERVGDKAADRADVEGAARELAIGSLVFNDLKQDIKGPVEIDTADMAATVAGFEKSGAAYVVYAACRARSILRRHGRAPARASDIADFTLDEREVGLLMLLQGIPGRVSAAARGANPSILVRHLLDVATAYNSYYAHAPVIVAGEADPARLLITLAVERALESALALCHVTCPEAI